MEEEEYGEKMFLTPKQKCRINIQAINLDSDHKRRVSLIYYYNIILSYLFY